MDTSPYKNVGNAESHEAALNILWLIKGCPPRILQKHLDADMGKAAKPEGTGKAYGGGLNHHRNAPRTHQEPARGNSAMADAFAKLKR